MLLQVGKMRKRMFWLLAPAVLLLLTGMGGLGGSPNGSLPETTENVLAVIIDRQNVRTEVSRFSMDGKVWLEGARGSGRMTIPFGQLAAVEFGTAAGEQVPAVLQLRSGETVRLGVNRGAVFYGSTGYGTFQIRARDVQRLEFP